ncbi:2Fe-2S iron-sulfur cluster-binding protein [Sphingomonas faeni]|uniref:2Fe-2S iron-sulfur cluster-binding protein n=1 Tax=Sphingomonas faeni TaxID=185950 RepID=UPI002788E225|nr:2Fe-2S iron-sulfur cluster-binding protein [Sphingomonas faeni]MDQ0837401.1 2Fe-2S ferredoxin [Sphingomonas faeni]
MADLIVTMRDGDIRTLAGKPGFSVMEIIRDGGVDELLALCGGSLSCATCHIIVDPAQAALLPSVADDEEDLLDGLDDRTPTSRLSCQIPFADTLDGLRVTIAPET